MSKQLVAVSNDILSEYVQNQLNAIADLHPALAIEHVNENDPIMDRFARYPDRLPAFFILKNGARMASLQAKVSTQELSAWINSTCS